MNCGRDSRPVESFTRAAIEMQKKVAYVLISFFSVFALYSKEVLLFCSCVMTYSICPSTFAVDLHSFLSHTPTHTLLHAHSHTHSLTRTRTHSLSHPHTHTPSHAHTLPYPHAPSLPPSLINTHTISLPQPTIMFLSSGTPGWVAKECANISSIRTIPLNPVVSHTRHHLLRE